jgi:hypothetical protein
MNPILIDQENIPPPVLNDINVTAEEVVSQVKYCDVLFKRKFESGIFIDNETLANAEAESLKVHFSFLLVNASNL